MATGDTNDMQGRLTRVIPWSWFPVGLVPLYVGVVAGLAAVFAQVYCLIAYVRKQTRLQTSTDGFLDLFAYDFFGDGGLPRRNGELDPTYEHRISLNLFRPRVTRAAVVKVLEDLTGYTPIIFEPRRPADTGAYGGPTLAYSAAGGYGSRSLTWQAFVTAFRPAQTGIPSIAGYGISTAGYGMGQAEYASLASISRNVVDADIYAAVNSVRPGCAILWTRVASPEPRAIETPSGLDIELPSGQDILAG